MHREGWAPLANAFVNAGSAFDYMYTKLNSIGFETGNGTKTFYNVGFYIENPLDRDIKIPYRRWSKSYADREWAWYLSQDRSVAEIKKYAPIWNQMHGGNDIVNSNYGYTWNLNNQLGKTIEQLLENHLTRQAWISIFDGKSKDEYAFDTPCTLAIGFQIVANQLCMNIMMRSNDIWYGFCNDQYCFSKLQEMVANELGIEVGWYHHFAANMHVYERNYL